MPLPSLPIGGFLPIPLAMMIPFMASQSAVMAKSFGENFQYGKRRISAMSNEEFNSLEYKDLLKQQTEAINEMIPELKESIEDTRELQAFVIRELFAILPNFISDSLHALDTDGDGKLSFEEILAGLSGATGIVTNPDPNPGPETTIPTIADLKSETLEAMQKLKAYYQLLDDSRPAAMINAQLDSYNAAIVSLRNKITIYNNNVPTNQSEEIDVGWLVNQLTESGDLILDSKERLVPKD